MTNYLILILILLYAVVKILLPIETNDESAAGVKKGFYSPSNPRFKPDRSPRGCVARP